MGRNKKYITEEERKQARRECQKRYRETHRKKMSETQIRYAEKHQDKIDEYKHSKMGRAIKLVSAYNQSDKKYGRGKGDLTAKWIVENIFTKSCKCGESDWHKLGCNRIDNSKPHTIDNVEPCCMECNKKLGSEEKKITLGKVVHQFNLDGELVKIWNSTRECGRNGFNQGAISACLNGKKEKYKGYKWSHSPL